MTNEYSTIQLTPDTIYLETHNQIPQMKGSVLQTVTLPHFRHQLQVVTGCHLHGEGDSNLLASDLLAIDTDSHDPLFGFD